MTPGNGGNRNCKRGGSHAGNRGTETNRKGNARAESGRGSAGHGERTGEGRGTDARQEARGSTSVDFSSALNGVGRSSVHFGSQLASIRGSWLTVTPASCGLFRQYQKDKVSLFAKMISGPICKKQKTTECTIQNWDYI